MYWASEEWIIRFAAEGRDEILEKQCWTLTSHRLYQFYTNKKGHIDFSTKDLEPRPFVVEKTHHRGKWTAEDWAEWESGSWAEDDTPATSHGSATSSETTTTMGPKKMQDGSNSTTATKNLPVLLDDKGNPVLFPEAASVRRVERVERKREKDEPFGMVKNLFQTEEAYKNKFGEEHCVLCGCELKDEYQHALMIDPETVACGTCHDFCELNEVKLV
jgi:hypothetical protein